MATITEWYNLYDRLAVASEASQTQLAGLNDAITLTLAPQFDELTAAVAAINVAVNAHLIPVMTEQAVSQDIIADSLAALVEAIPDELGDSLKTLIDQLIVSSIRFDVEVAPNVFPMADALYHLAYGGGTVNGPINDAMIRLSTVLDQMLAEASPNVIANLGTYLKGAAGWIPTLVTVAPLVLDLLSRVVPKELSDKILATVGIDFEYIRDGVGALSNAMSTPFDLLVATGLADFQSTLLAGGPGDPSTAPARATALLQTAHRLGLAAHTIGAAAEAFTPLKALGFTQAAAAIGDLAGFKPISAKVAESFVDGAITRPMHYWGNAQFMPEFMPPRDLIEMVHKREIDLPTYNGMLQYHGFNDADRALYERTVWRDPAVRDLALALQDATTDYEWILERVLKMGYSDEDAPRIATALFQRTQASSRGKVVSAAAAAFSDGYTDEGSFRSTLGDLGLRPETIELEVSAARLRELSDYVAQAVATYKKQYLNGVIDSGAFILALAGLGVNNDRAYLILADADAQRFPKIQAEEEAAVKEEMAAIRSYLVPRYRALFLDDFVTADEYLDTLILSGLDPQLAGQVVNLDALRKQIG
jgi:hypothetical protein